MKITKISSYGILNICLGLIIATAAFYLVIRDHKTSAELAAYKKVSQEQGVVQVSSTDGKRYVSFALKSYQNAMFRGETPEFLAALDSLKYIRDLRGVHLDGCNVTMESLKRLQAIESLELVTVRDTGLTYEDVCEWKSRLPQSGKPPVKVLTTY